MRNNNFVERFVVFQQHVPLHIFAIYMSEYSHIKSALYHKTSMLKRFSFVKTLLAREVLWSFYFCFVHTIIYTLTLIKLI